MKSLLIIAVLASCFSVVLASDEAKTFNVEATVIGPNERTPEAAESKWDGDKHQYFWTTVKILKSEDPSLEKGKELRLLTSKYDRDLIGKGISLTLVLNPTMEVKHWLVCTSLSTAMRVSQPDSPNYHQGMNKEEDNKSEMATPRKPSD